MLLQVEFENFAETVRRTLPDVREVFVSERDSVAVVTAAKPGLDAVVIAVAESLDGAWSTLEEQGFSVFRGRWTEELELDAAASAKMHVAGVAYKSDAGGPGLWMDAFQSLPTQMQVLRGMFEELLETGEVTEVAFEEFIRLAEPNVVILTPEELRSFIVQKLAG